MLHNGTQILFDYWQDLKAGRPAPFRVEIEPSAIAKILPSTFILENDGTKPFEFRLAGTSLCLLFGTELKSHSFESLLDQHERRLTERLLNAVHTEKTVLQMLFHCISETGRDVYLECVILPLSDADPRLVGALHILDMPYWVGAEKIVSTNIASVRLLDADRDLISLHNRPPIKFTDREKLKSIREKKPCFSVLQGGAMLSGQQIAQTGSTAKRPRLRVLQGGRI